MAKTQAESNMDDPLEAFAWMFSAGIPDMRGGGGKFPNQPLVPPQCWPAVSQMLWDFGCRFHADKQTKWIKPAEGPLSNFTLGQLADSPEEMVAGAAAMAVDQFPEIAAEVAAVQPGDHEKALKEFEGRLLDSVSRLQAARQRLEGGAANDDA